MHKIRIKKQPKTGDQKDFSLVQNTVWREGAGIGTPDVKNTMGAIDRDKANVEVEGGETVVGDVNGDGFLEHMSFVGKRHSQGGMPVNLPEGSFIFSDTKKLRIKDQELLSKVFGMGKRKGGYTPAEIAKKYQINEYVAILKDEEADPLKKRTAAQMLKNNTDMLSKLALLQESMKGFPDGIPALAESAAMAMQGGAEQAPEQPMARMGGTMRYDNGGKVGQKFYVDGKENKIVSRYEGFWDTAGGGSDEWVKFQNPIKLPNGETISELPLKDFLELEKNKKLDLGMHTGNFLVDPAYYTSVNNLGWGNQAPSLPGRGNKFYTINFSTDPKAQPVKSDLPKVGDTFTENNVKYKVVGFVTDSDGRNVQVQQVSDPNQNIGSYFNTYAGKKVIPVDEYNAKYNKQAKQSSSSNQNNAFGNDMVTPINKPNKPVIKDVYTLKGKDFEYRPGTVNGKKVWQYKEDNGQWYTVTNQTSVDRLNNHYGFNLAIPGSSPAPKSSTPAPKASTPRPAAPAAPKQGGYTDANDLLNSFAYGGYVAQYELAGEVEGEDPTKPLQTTVANQQELQQKTNQRVDPNAEVLIRKDTLNGKPVTLYYKGNEKIIKDEAGNIIARGPRTDGAGFEQYGSQNINKILAQTPNVRYTNTNFGSFGRQPNVKGTGIYLSSGNAQARSNNDLSPEEWQDFQDRHGDWIEKEYPGGFAKYKQDLQTSRQTGDAAAAWFQDKVNEKSMKQFGVPYFAAIGAKGEDTPYYRDSKFGQVTYSVPRFFDLEQPGTPPETPPGKELVAYYCVEAEDGTKSVQAVNYKEGEQPVPPTGKNVSTAFADKGSADKICAISPDSGGTPTPAKKPSGPWWLPDIVNFVGAMTDDVNRYEPTQGKVAYQNSGYDLLDPTRQIANAQEKDARTQQQIENTVDGNVGLAATLGQTGESIGHSANILGQYENANIGIVNNAYDKNAAITNQEAATNEAGRVKYVEDMATLNQNIDNAMKRDKWTKIAAFNNGTSNWFRKKQMEQVLFPEVYIDPILGDTEVTPGFSNRNLFGPDTYSPAYAGRGTTAQAGSQQGITAWQQAYEEARGTMGDESARRYADRVAASYIPSQSQQVTGPTPRQQYNQMVQQGLVLPAPNRAYGGEFELPWEEI